MAKVCEEFGRGELWLGPLPTQSRIDYIMQTDFSIQVYCFLNDPEEITVTEGGEAGMRVPDTIVFRCEMSNHRTRGGDLKLLLPCLINSLRQGDNAYIHCVSGLSRAPVAAAIVSAKLMCTSFAEAKYIVDQVRHVKFEGYHGKPRDLEGPWIEGIMRATTPEAVAPTGFSCCLSRTAEGWAHASAPVEDGIAPICRWRKGPAHRRNFKAVVQTVSSLEEAAAQFGGKFCSSCAPLLRASLGVQINHLW